MKPLTPPQVRTLRDALRECARYSFYFPIGPSLQSAKALVNRGLMVRLDNGRHFALTDVGRVAAESTKPPPREE